MRIRRFREDNVTHDRDPSRPSVPAEVYDADYFLQGCEGYEEFLHGGVSQRLLAGLNLVSIQPGQRALDIACGRGDAAFWLADQGAWVWGLDYSTQALHIARDRAQALTSSNRMCLSAANARVLPFADDSFDHALMMDVLEHLYPWELHEALSEAHRVLRPGGRLVVHTAPNLWHYRVGYPVFRFTERVRGRKLPADPRQRFRYHSLMHVNEQSPRSLKQAMSRVGFRVRIRVDSSRTDWGRMGKLSRCAGRIATSLFLVKWVTSSDIFAIGFKD
jgi:ubiquinone/menaquinone biosynthesis C-methylase UbiE